MRDTLPSRRQFLAGGLVAAAASSAGCLGVFAERDERESQPLELVLTREDGTLHESHVVESDDRPDQWADGAVEAAIVGEQFTTQYRKPFFTRPEDPVYLHHEGTYYELGSVVVDEVTERRPVLRLSLIEERTDVPGVTPDDELPDGDRDAVRVAHMAARARGTVGGVPSGLVERGGFVYRDPSAIEESVLLADDGPDRVRHRDRIHEVSVIRERFHEPVYRATAEAVAGDAERMESILRARFVDARFDRDDLSEDAHDVLRGATGDSGYEESHPYSEGYAELLTAMHKRVFLDGNIEKDAGRIDRTGTIMLDGEYYDYWLAFGDGSSDE